VCQPSRPSRKPSRKEVDSAVEESKVRF
jgi:hypothetical protein